MKMKRFILWTLLASILSLCIGVSITAYQGNFRLEKRVIDLSKTASIDDVDLIKVQSGSADIIIAPTEEREISLRYYGTLRSNKKTDPTVEIDKVGKDLKIKSGMPLGFLWYSTASFDDFKLEVKIPSSYHKKLEVQTNFGDTEISSLVLEKLITRTGSKGSVKIAKCQSEQEVSAALGDITIIDESLSFNKTIKSTFGDIRLFVPEKSNFNFVFDTDSGNLINVFSLGGEQSNIKHTSGTIGDGQHSIVVKTKTGDLNISKSI